jgi:hypothetical protein
MIRHREIFSVIQAVLLMCLWGVQESSAQLIGEVAEMDRLEQRAQELTAQGDPEGASQTFGKAAMMADILQKDAHDPSTQAVFQATSLFHRAQEQGLRAVALFERTGGQPPAPPGVCHFLVDSTQKLEKTHDQLEQISDISQDDLQERRRNLLRQAQEWTDLFQGLQEDFSCFKN